jgi:signal transduction histidine kinase
MKYPNETIFLMASVMLMGILASAIPHLRSRSSLKPNSYWIASLVLATVSHLSFAIAPHITIYLLTIANSLFLASYAYFAMCCRSLNQPITQRLKVLIPSIVLVHGVLFELIRQLGTFQMRVTWLVGTSMCFLVWEFVELLRITKINKSNQLQILKWTIALELLLATLRLSIILIEPTATNIHLYEEPFVTASLRWAWFSLSVLSYITMTGFWTERLALESANIKNENAEINMLLTERDVLISDLVKTKKLVETGALSASLSHELMQPLLGIELNTSTLQQQLQNSNSDASAIELLTFIQEDNKRASDIIVALRGIFTNTVNKYEITNLDDFVKSTTSLYLHKAKQEKILIELDLNASTSVLINTGELQHVLMNLLGNAVNALMTQPTPNPRILIQTLVDGGIAKIIITDNGPGVDKEAMPALFNLMSYSARGKGMGLGLWLSKFIVERHDGTLSHHDANHTGAVFTVTLPVHIAS